MRSYIGLNVPFELVITTTFFQVLETGRQVGRLSVSAAPELPYGEMARQCEALLVGSSRSCLYL